MTGPPSATLPPRARPRPFVVALVATSLVAAALALGLRSQLAAQPAVGGRIDAAAWERLTPGMSVDEALRIAPEVGRDTALEGGARRLEWTGPGGTYTAVVREGALAWLVAPAREVKR